METYVVLRRGGWRTEEELETAAEVSTRVSEEMGGQVVWIRTYVLAEGDGTLGTVCVYQAESEDALREHDRLAGLPVDDMVTVATTMIAAPDPEPIVAMA